MAGHSDQIEHASNFVFNHIPHGVCYWGQSVDVAYTCLGLHKLSSFVTRSTLRAHCLLRTRWKLCRWWNFLWLRKWTDHWHTSVFYASGKMGSWYWLDKNCQTRTECCVVTSIVGASTHTWDNCSNTGRTQMNHNRCSVFKPVVSNPWDKGQVKASISDYCDRVCEGGPFGPGQNTRRTFSLTTSHT